jgi:hypothetical protein
MRVVFHGTISLSRKFHKMNCRRIARDVYGLAESAEPIAALVKEALDVIDDGLDRHGWGIAAILPFRKGLP